MRRRLRLRRLRRRRLPPPPLPPELPDLLPSLALVCAGAICVNLAICLPPVSLFSVDLTRPMMRPAH